jgi:hypothetical protein
MEDWQEMLIIILFVLLCVFGYFIYMGYQIAGLQKSISQYNDENNAITGASGASPSVSPFGIFGGFGGFSVTGGG